MDLIINFMKRKDEKLFWVIRIKLAILKLQGNANISLWFD
jgi:hypothetical protein